MLSPLEKTFSKHQKIPNKNFAHTSRHSMCMCQISRKTDIFCVLRKKDKKMSRATPILASILYFYTQHNFFFHETTL
jgi:hypothetical protein